jgi:hypothetical protein
MLARLSISFPRFRLVTARRYGLFAVSYRGYGGSSGSPTQSGLPQDGEAAIAKRTGEAMMAIASF